MIDKRLIYKYILIYFLTYIIIKNIIVTYLLIYN